MILHVRGTQHVQKYGLDVVMQEGIVKIMPIYLTNQMTQIFS